MLTGASGTINSLDVTLNFFNSGGSASWPADMMIEIGLPDGSCYAIGGYDVISACTDLGNYAVVASILADCDCKDVHSKCGFVTSWFDRYGTVVVHVGEWLERQCGCGLRRDIDLEWPLHLG